ncbi:MAG: hypothetical protein OXM55_00035 [Bdellovibrionales bacterium]|nr:hypothetical protein [Bdellovibrionales bacterium]
MKLVKNKMGMSWYIKLNIMVMGFLFVVFLIKQINTSSFRNGLDHIFTSSRSKPKPSVQIKIKPPEKEREKRGHP